MYMDPGEQRGTPKQKPVDGDQADAFGGRAASSDGYPPEWEAVSLQTKIDSNFRCVRCGHPNARISPTGNDHPRAAEALAIDLGAGTPVRVYEDPRGFAWLRHHMVQCDEHCTHDPDVRDHRILTVHHLDGNKANLAWWNLCSLDQRCHLTIQGKVKMGQTYQLPHSTWFLPYVAGFYAQVLEEQPTREEVEADLATYLTLGQPHLEEHYRELLG